MDYKVCITAAGIGSRISKISSINKALLPVGFESVLTRIIKKFPKKIQIIIAVGYQKEKIIDFINISHSDRNIKIVEVNNFDKTGSGPGYSMLKCSKYLQCPFVFVACDTLIKGKIPKPNKNWIGISSVEDPENFLVVESEKNYAKRFFDKKSKNFLYWNGYKNSECNCFIGLAGIKNYKVFWNSLKKNKSLNDGELQVSNGLDGLKKKKIICKKFKWFDTGNEFNYIKTLNYFSKDYILPKPDEYFYKENNLIIKYFKDENKALGRYERSFYLQKLVPTIINKKSKNFIGYRYINGKLLSNLKSIKVFKNFLKFCEKNLWNNNFKKFNYKIEIKKLRYACYKFYKLKTYQRVEEYFIKYKIKDSSSIINNIKIPKTIDLLKKINWKDMLDCYPVLFHGDLQPENIIYSRNKSFFLIDWREDFGGLKIVGDLYYDLAKLHHALIVNGQIIRDKKFKIKKKGNKIFFYIKKRPNLIKYLYEFENYVQSKNWSIKKLKIISSLIYLNIATLHHYPYSDFLYNFGRYNLFRALSDK